MRVQLETQCQKRNRKIIQIDFWPKTVCDDNTNDVDTWRRAHRHSRSIVVLRMKFLNFCVELKFDTKNER